MQGPRRERERERERERGRQEGGGGNQTVILLSPLKGPAINLQPLSRGYKVLTVLLKPAKSGCLLWL